MTAKLALLVKVLPQAAHLGPRHELHNRCKKKANEAFLWYPHRPRLLSISAIFALCAFVIALCNGHT